MSTHKSILLFSLSFYLTCFGGERLEIFCSPSGSDSASGSISSPMKTLYAARDKLRTMRKEKSLPNGGAAIILRGGRYKINETLLLTSEDSGEESRPVRIEAFKGETPILDGSVPIEGWRVYSESIIAATVKDILPDEPDFLAPWGFGISDKGFKYPDLYENGSMMELARHPNKGYAKIFSVDTDKGWISADLGDLSKCKSSEGILAQGYWKNYWSDRAVRVVEIGDTNGLFRIAIDELKTTPRKGRRCRLLNDLHFLDEPGEWYFDRKSGIIYAIARGKNPSFRISKFAKPFIEFNEVSNFVVEGLVFEGGRSGAVVIKKGNQISFIGNVVRNFGRNGVVAGGSNLLFFSNVFHTFGGGALRVRGGNRKTLSPSGIVIENNIFSDIERRWRTYRPALFMDGVSIRVSRNRFYNTPSSAIRLEGNDHLVSSNLVEDCVLESDDQGAIDIYANPTYAGNRIIGNVWRRIGRGGPMMHAGQAAVRLDDFISGVEISGNRFYDCGHWKVFGAVQINGGRHNVITNNYFEKCRKNVSNQRRSDERWRSTLTGNKRVGKNLRSQKIDAPPYSERYPDLKNILDWKGNTITNNFTYPQKDIPSSIPSDDNVGPILNSTLKRALENDSMN